MEKIKIIYDQDSRLFAKIPIGSTVRVRENNNGKTSKDTNGRQRQTF